MIVLVTGGGGFLGRGIVNRLVERGHKVRVLARGSYPELSSKGVEVIRGDLSDGSTVRAACAGCDVVFHAGAKAGVWGRHDDYVQTNLEGTRNVLAACELHKVPRLVYTSSPSVTFDGHEAINSDESLPYPERFETSYSETKAAAERLVLLAAREGKIHATALRPHLIWGPGDPHLLPRVIKAARAGRLMIVGDGSNLVDITYIDNAVEAHIQAANRLGPGSPANGRAYFLSQGKPVFLWSWINDILRQLAIPEVTRHISLTSARRLGRVLETVYRTLHLPGEPRMTRFVASQLGTSHYYDISAARRDLGYEPLVSTDEGVEKLVTWLRESGL